MTGLPAVRCQLYRASLSACYVSWNTVNFEIQTEQARTDLLRIGLSVHGGDQVRAVERGCRKEAAYNLTGSLNRPNGDGNQAQEESEQVEYR